MAREETQIEIVRDAQQRGWAVYVNGHSFLLPDNYPHYLETFDKQLRMLGICRRFGGE